MKKETLKQAGYVKIEKTYGNFYILTDKDGKREMWLANKNHASYGIKYRNTHLEFAHSI
jgi:regulatory protein YycI of two-component signal transduction system YycFG